MTTATVLNSSGAEFVISNTVLNSSGASFSVGNDALNSSGSAFAIFSGVEESTGGANVPYGFTLTKELRADEEIVMQFAREYMKRVH